MYMKLSVKFQVNSRADGHSNSTFIYLNYAQGILKSFGILYLIKHLFNTQSLGIDYWLLDIYEN